jgi:hypothetical protein
VGDQREREGEIEQEEPVKLRMDSATEQKNQNPSRTANSQGRTSMALSLLSLTDSSILVETLNSEGDLKKLCGNGGVKGLEKRSGIYRSKRRKRG